MLQLLKFELKKIIKRPFAIVVIVGCMLTAIFVPIIAFNSNSYASGWGPDIYGSVDDIPKEKIAEAYGYFFLGEGEEGPVMFKGFEAVKLEKEYMKQFEGYWDNERINSIARDYYNFQNNPDHYTDEVDEYSMSMRSWSFSSQGMAEEEIEIYNSENPIRIMKPEYYFGDWQKLSLIGNLFERNILNNDGSVNSFEDVFPNTREPSYFSYHQGPLFAVQMQSGFVGLLIIIILIAGAAPIFSDEVSNRTEPMLMAAKYGRSKLIWAKLSAVLVFTVAGTIIFTLINLATAGILYGFEGFNVAVQFDYLTFNVPFSVNYGQYLLVILGLQIVGLCATTLIIALLSSLMRSAIPVVFTGGLACLLINFFANNGPNDVRPFFRTLPPAAANPGIFINTAKDSGWGPFSFMPIWLLCIVMSVAIAAAASLIIIKKQKSIHKV